MTQQLMKSEKNFLERLADSIPGLKGYRAREEARETDRRLRDYLASRIDAANRGLDEAKKAALKSGGLAAMNDFDGLDARLSTSANRLRHARYGYSPFFAQVKIGEAELSQIYDLDMSLIGLTDQLEHGAKSGQPALLRSALDGLDRQLEAREKLFDIPQG